jgi:hypothetical protein
MEAYLLHIVHDLLIAIRITLPVDNNRDGTIRQPKRYLTVLGASKSTDAVKINYIFISLITNFYPIRHKASSHKGEFCH